jgi:GT2 family glycosyltransferase
MRPEGESRVSGCRGIVVIGRNEGERLVRCLEALAGLPDPIVYVDSGSSDASVARAAALGAEVVELDASAPFTAARGRNAGVWRLRERHPQLEFVQLLDGDCEPRRAWLPAAEAFLTAHADVAMVCGRLLERHPEASPYNRLAQREWDGPPGDIADCGGNAMVRVAVFERLGGFDARMIAGEEPELCLRMRRAGYRIVRLADEMAVHDAAIFGFRQWWRRQVRSGHSYAEILLRQAPPRERYWVRKAASIAAWGGLLPLAALAPAPATRGASLLLLGLYGVLWLRLLRHAGGGRDAALYATACTLGKFAELQGALRFAWNHFVRRRRGGLIEYKGAQRGGSAPT